MINIVSLLLLLILGFENQLDKPEVFLFEENFDDSELERRGWYDGTAIRI